MSSLYYIQTLLYEHPPNMDTSLLSTVWFVEQNRIESKTLLMCWSHIAWEQPHTNLSLGKESPQIFSKFNPLNTDTPLIWTLSISPSVTVLKGFDCISRRAVCLGCCTLQSQCIYFLYIFYFYTFALLSHLRENSTINTLSVESRMFLVEQISGVGFAPTQVSPKRDNNTECADQHGAF